MAVKKKKSTSRTKKSQQKPFISDELKRKLFNLAKSSAKKTLVFIKDTLVLVIPLISKKKKILLIRLNPYLTKKEIAKVKRRIKQKKAKIHIVRKGFSFLISSRDICPKIESDDPVLKEYNKKIEQRFWDETIQDFSLRAWQAIPEYIAPNTLGMKHVKQAITLLLASKKMSFLLIGNPSVDKQEFLSNAEDLTKSKIEYFELKKLTEDQRFFISVKDLGKTINRTKAENCLAKNNCRLLSSASFKEELFEKIPKNYLGKTSVPQDIAYRFNLIFLLKAIDVTKFEELAESIVRAKKVELNKKDAAFIRKYLASVASMEVDIPAAITKKIKDFSTFLKKREKELNMPVNEKTLLTLAELIRASARLDMRTKAEEKDADRVFDIFRKSLE